MRNFILKIERTSEESNLDKLLQENADAVKTAGAEMVMPSGGGSPAPYSQASIRKKQSTIPN